MRHLKKFLVKVMLAPLLGVFTLMACGKEEVPSNELIAAGDIEDTSLVQKVWWKNTNGNNHSIIVTDQVSYSPSKSLKILLQEQEPSTFAFWAQTITSNLPLEREVTLRVKVKGKLVGQGVSLVIRTDDTSAPSGTGEQFVTTQGTVPISGNFDWTEYSIKLGSVDTKAKSITVYLVYLANTSGEAYFDDISLTF